ncbi:hypothetical protein ACHAXA_007161 [Cyclostephanos tholiformis]|uniref:Uncharacterized protein n=1 Tax=Cyclostephanos tholiformis TaxID=382380 RepID=A0ABD3RE42_9STRA
MACRKLSLRNVAKVIATGTICVSSSPPAPLRAGGHDDDDDDDGSSMNWHIIAHRLHPPPRQVLVTSNALCEGRIATTSADESDRFELALARHRSQLLTYRRKWEYSAGGTATTSTKTPSRSWPDDVPPDDDLSFLLEDVKYCDRSPRCEYDEGGYCDRLRFRVASALLVQLGEDSQRTGLRMLRSLAEKNHPDAMVYYGICLNDGRAGMEPNPEGAVSWFERSSEIFGHPQGQYELGVAYYTGEGATENEAEAVRLFKLAAKQHHAAACYMLGDCLLDGVGTELDRATALEWLVRAAELGHRGARSRVMAVLEKREGEDYGNFTDASRQTLAGRNSTHANEAGGMVRRGTTMLSQTEIARRRTIASNSRRE